MPRRNKFIVLVDKKIESKPKPVQDCPYKIIKGGRGYQIFNLLDNTHVSDHETEESAHVKITELMFTRDQNANSNK